MKKEKNLLIPNEQTQPLLEVISKATYNNEYVNFFVSDKFLIIECGSFRASIAAYDSDIKWPNESDFLTRKNSLVFTTKISDWSNVVRGISATYNQDMKKQHDMHYATLDLNIGKKEITAKTEGMMKSSRKISVKDTKVIDNDMFKDGKFAFTCISQYIAEAIKNGSEDECIQIEAENARKPIIIRYHADSNGTVGDSSEFARANPVFGIKEKFSIFFAPKKQQD
jgi:hypothetical protein